MIFTVFNINIIIDDHDGGSLAGSYPVLVLDMFEHARRDYLGDKGWDKMSYIKAMMNELDWNIITERFNRAESIVKALK